MLGRRSFLLHAMAGLAGGSVVGCGERHGRIIRERVPSFAGGALRVSHGGTASRPSIYVRTSSELHIGDCTLMTGAEFIFYVDGFTHWECNLSSTDTGDEWDLDAWLYPHSIDPPNSFSDPLAYVQHFHFNVEIANTTKHWVQDYAPNAVIYLRSGLGPLELLQQTGWIGLACGC
jgi:hypothetical protein